MKIEDIKHELLTQDNRSTSFPIFIVVEDKKVWGVDQGSYDGRERNEDYDEPLCDECEALVEGNGQDKPDDCDNCPSEAFHYYRIEKDVPNLYAGFFFTAKACEEHLKNCYYHYNSTAHSYAISATHNTELKIVIDHLKNL